MTTVADGSSSTPLHEVPVGKRSRRREWIARLRGEQTLQRMRKAGLDAPQPVYVGARVYIDEMFAWAISIGAHTRIAHDVLIIAHDAATKHLTGYTEIRSVKIGAGCYIGAGVIVLPGAEIGDGAVIGAGSVVRGQIPAGAIAAGSPAKVVKDTSELRARHADLQAQATPLDKRPMDGLSAAEQARMRAVLAEHGRVYVR